MVQRWNVCAIVFWRVVWYHAGTFLLCDRGCGCVASVVAVAWPSCPGRRDVPGHGRRDVAVASLGAIVARRGRGCVASAVFVSPSCGCDTPTNASVCNGFGGVCVVLVCYLTG